MNQLRFGTWNILGDDFDRDKRMQMISNDLKGLDFVTLQEIVIDESIGLNTAKMLSDFSEMEIASCISGDITNLITGDMQATAILSNIEIVNPNLAIFAPKNETNITYQEYSKYSAAVLRAPNGRMILVVSVHLPWGAQNELRRLEHAVYIDKQITEIMQTLPKDAIAILMGDFNCTPNAECMRLLRGETAYKEHSTFWVDVWAEIGDGPGYTFDPKTKNLNLIETAIRSGIKDPELMPPRRLDFILLKGWVFGKPGSPLKSRLIGNRPNLDGTFASDHFGVSADIWNPF